MVDLNKRMVLACFFWAGAGAGQDRDPRLGVKVVTKYMKPLTDDGRPGADRAAFRAYTVRGASGGSLLLASGGVERWVAASDVLPYDRAVGFYSEEIDRDRNNQAAYNCRGVLYLDRLDHDRAIADFAEAIRLNPDDGWAYTNRGVARRDKKDHAGSVADGEEATRREPRNPGFHANLAGSHVSRRDYDRAFASYNEAIRLDARFVPAFVGRSIAWHRVKDYGKSVTDGREAVRLDPKSAMAHNTLAWTLATCPEAGHRDGKEAAASANKACELDAWKTANYLGTLAAAHAECGRFDLAIKGELEAIKRTSPGAEELAGRKGRLALYREGKPCREP